MAWSDGRSRGVLKQALAAAAVGSGGLAALRAARRALGGSTVRIFGYHMIVDDAAAAGRLVMPPLCVSRRSFAAHLDHLAHHYHVWPLARAAAALVGEEPLPRDRDVAVLTFDDAYQSVLTHAAPLLRERRLPATLFVPTGMVGGRLLHDRVYALVRRAARARFRLLALPAPAFAAWPLARADAALAQDDALCAADALLLSLPQATVELLAGELARQVGEPDGAEVPAVLDWSELAELQRIGFDIGAHTVSHAQLTLESPADMERELAAARLEIGLRLGVAPQSLAYPAGLYDERVVDAARRAGYSIAVTTEDRPCRPGDSPLRLGRKVLTEAHALGGDGTLSPALVAAQLDGLFTALGVGHIEPGDLVREEPWIA